MSSPHNPEGFEFTLTFLREAVYSPRTKPEDFHAPIMGTQHAPSTPQTSSPYLTSYGEPEPISPGLSGPLSQMHLPPSDSQPDFRLSASHQMLNSFDFLTSSSFEFLPLTQSQPGIPAGTESISVSSPHDRDGHRVRPTIQTQFSTQSTSYPSSSSTASGATSPFPPTPITPALGTCPTFHTKPLPGDDDDGQSPVGTIDPTLLQPPPSLERGRRIGGRSGVHRRSHSALGGSNQLTGVSLRPARYDTDRRVNRRQRSRSPPPLNLHLKMFSIDYSDDSSPIISDGSMSVLFAESMLSPFQDGGLGLGDNSQVAGDGTDAVPGAGQEDNNKRSTASPSGRSAFRPVVASEEVVLASKSRRTTRTPRFPCPVEGCPADFTAKHNLKNHLNAHNGVKPYGCPHCERSYTTSHVLNRHMTTCKRAKKGKRKGNQ
ncbi:hypothetical protein V5O48_006481 [Marasmius crinis-equi]|uniref:C2H2-type domain-containing protein n=1 Tax=Marasmius crinis-equi TaxID=585013 RepID=A0ABR3FJS3_9AGAR